MLRRSFITLATVCLLSTTILAEDKPGEWKELFKYIKRFYQNLLLYLI